MQANDIFRSARRGRDLHQVQGRSVRREDGAGLHDPVEGGKEGALELKIFEIRPNRHVRAGKLRAVEPQIKAMRFALSLCPLGAGVAPPFELTRHCQAATLRSPLVHRQRREYEQNQQCGSRSGHE